MSDNTKDPNARFRLRLDGKDSLRILLSDKSNRVQKQVTQSQQSQPEGMILAQRPEDDLIIKPKQLGINFYDLGQVWNATYEDWFDINFSVAPVPHNSGSVLTFDEFLEADWTALTDLIFTADPSTWKTYYRKLEYTAAERYGLDIRDRDTSALYPVARAGSRYNADGMTFGTTKWQTKGLVFDTPPTNFKIEALGAFVRFTNNTSDFKITNSPSYASPEVSFTLGKSADVFLVPQIQNLYVIGSDAGFVNYELMQGAWRPLSRGTFLDLYDSAWAGYTFGLESILATPADSTPRSVLNAYSLVDARQFHVDATTITEVTPSWPTYVPSQTNLTLDAAQSNAVVGGNIGTSAKQAHWYEGSFVGAIKQNGQMYYFWAKAYGFDSNTRYWVWG